MSKSALHRVPPYKRPILIIGFLSLLGVVILVTVLICKNLNFANNHQDPKPDDGNNIVVDNPPAQPSDEPTTPDEPENKAPQYEGEDPNALGELTGDIIYIDIDPDTEVLHSAVMLNQLLSESGQCVYNITRNDMVMRTASSATTNDPSNSVCGPFHISVEGLAGTYQVEVVITGDGKRGVITQNIQI